MRVKEAWKVVAEDKMTYAKALSSVVKSKDTKTKPDSAHALGGRPDSTAIGRADVIEATGRDARPIYLAAVVEQRRTARKSTCSTECQTEPEVVTVVTQTSAECSTQTESLPEERACQTSTDVEIQTVKVSENFDAEDKYAMASVFEMIGLMLNYVNQRVRTDSHYERVRRQFQRSFKSIIERNYMQDESDDSDESDDEESNKCQEERGPVTRQHTAKSN